MLMGGGFAVYFLNVYGFIANITVKKKNKTKQQPQQNPKCKNEVPLSAQATMGL